MRFTIVTPSFNQLDWLELCIASVADQQGVEFVEHIVQDAGTLGIEEFARRLGADFYRDGKRVDQLASLRVSPSRGAQLGAQCSVNGESVGADGGNVEECEGMKVGKRKSGSAEEQRHREGGNVERKRYSLTIYSEKDAGMYDAVNRGLRKASGEICAYLNCDEQYLPGTLCWVADFFGKAGNVEVLFGDVITVAPSGEALCHRRASLPHPWHVMVAQLPIFTAATFFRSEIVKKGLLFPDGWRDLGDAVWAIELHRRGVRCCVGRRFFSTFTYTGENMNLQPNARAERVRLADSAPWVAKIFSMPIIWTHRILKWFSGAYQRENLSYEIWCGSSRNQRTRFDCNGLSWTWPGLAKMK